MHVRQRNCGWARQLTIGLVAVLLVACGAGESGEPVEEGTPELPLAPVADDAVERPLIVTTTSILGDILTELVDDDATVEVLMPPGVDPHSYQPSAADGALLRRADLVVSNGLQLEINLTSVLDAVVAEGHDVYAFAEPLDPLPFDDDGHDHGHGHDDDHGHGHDDDHGHGHDDDHGHGHDDDDGHDSDHHDHDHGDYDPHVWFDPVRMIDGVRLLADELSARIPDLDADVVSARADAYVDELASVHDEMVAMFATLPESRRVLVTNHDSFGYLAKRYDFTVIGTIIPGISTQAEADPRGFAALIETVEQAGVPAIFTESIQASRLADQLAREVAARGGSEIAVVELYTDALGAPDSDAATYLDLLRTTATRIVTALAA